MQPQTTGSDGSPSLSPNEDASGMQLLPKPKPSSAESFLNPEFSKEKHMVQKKIAQQKGTPTRTTFCKYTLALTAYFPADAYEKRVNHLIRLLVQAFVEVYDAYTSEQGDAAPVPIPIPTPPTKKAKLADPSLSLELDLSHGPSPTASENQLVRPQIFHLYAGIHYGAPRSDGIKVTPPHQYSYAYQDADGTDDEDEDGAEAEGEDDAQTASQKKVAGIFAGRTILLTRKVCANCCTAFKGPMSFPPVPKYAYWTDGRAIPDGCPKCFRVLFRRNG